MDEIKLAKIDAEQHQSIADKYEVKAFPTFILFKDGKPVARFEGAAGMETAEQIIQRVKGVKQQKD